MPQVASEATTQAYKPALPNPVRAAPSSDSASNTPFDSLIDDGTLAPASQPPQSPAAPTDKTAAQPDSAAQPPAKTNGAKAAQAKGDTKVAEAATNPDTAIAAAATDIAVTNGKVPGDGKAKADDAAKPAGDSKPADSAAPAALVADPANGVIQTPAPAVAVVAPVAPVQDVSPPVTPGQAGPAALAQTVAAAQPAIVATAPPRAKRPTRKSHKPIPAIPPTTRNYPPRRHSIRKATESRSQLPATPTNPPPSKREMMPRG